MRVSGGGATEGRKGMLAADAPGAQTPAAKIDPAIIRSQLERILASEPFRNSKRYPALLRYVVEMYLKGASAELKERTLGIEVFGRDPLYDPGMDPVVRISAGEVRKRLAQYYQATAAANELRIELPVGSYQPEFVAPKTEVFIPSLPPIAMQPVLVETPQKIAWRKLAVICAAVALALVVAGAFYRSARQP